MLEDIGKIKEFIHCIAKAKRTTQFIYAHTRLLDLMRSLNGKKNIVRPGATRFVTYPHLDQHVVSKVILQISLC
jgi:hypothetical protein